MHNGKVAFTSPKKCDELVDKYNNLDQLTRKLHVFLGVYFLYGETRYAYTCFVQTFTTLKKGDVHVYALRIPQTVKPRFIILERLTNSRDSSYGRQHVCLSISRSFQSIEKSSGDCMASSGDF